jgi:hypothetical protein
MSKNYNPSANRKALLIVFAVVFSIFFLNRCGNSPRAISPESEITEGKVLAQKYCVSCHRFPWPELIDRESWLKGVLPAMAKQLGVHVYMGQYFCDERSALTTPEWLKIVAYYKTAPVSLTIPKPAVAPLKDWANFSLKQPANVNRAMPAMTTMISFDPNSKSFYTADAANNLYKWDARLNSKLVYKFDSPVTGLDYFTGTGSANTGIVTCIGNLAPVNLSKGKVLLLDLDAKSKQTPVLISDSLPRPVQTVAADFNKDGLMDYIVCGFGHDRGGLFELQQQPNHSFKKIAISNIAGGEQLITGDFNNDGWPDVMCLFAQADEGIRMYLNDRKGGFTTQTLLRFPPVYGSSSFQLVDFNHDGRPDILYTCGDNSDYSKVLKPYHGVYIFTNQGNWKFKQTYFYHIDGCTKAIAADFDHSGKLNIAAIAFFADFKYHPQEGFTYLQQISPNNFIAHELPLNMYGRWLTMQVADIDHDGYDDIIIGNFSTTGRGLVNQTGFKPNWDMHEPIAVLKNKGKRIK